MMSPEELLAKYEGHIVPQRFNAGFVLLSYIVSLIGAGSTLELINRRTGSKGLFNNVLLGGAAVTMGGVAIWSMHFVGNRAVFFGNGEDAIQVGFSPLFTAISFFVPILVLLVAFLAVGANNVVSWFRVCAGGFLCGAAVCGMHYLGNASIENYACSYRASYVVGSAVIAVMASTVALAVFFVFRSMWANVWWKRLLSALLLAGAVSGMHWCAALGTEYTLVSIEARAGGMARDVTVIIVICLALSACLIIAGLAMLTASNMNESARRAQNITLAAALFDKEGRILVDTDGLIPTTVVTDSFVPMTDKQPFTVSHPYFLWMFQATRTWPSLVSLIEGMKRYTPEKPPKRTPEESPSPSSPPPPRADQGLLFRGQFCLAAARLTDRLRQDVASAGVLWDEILATGVATAETETDTAPGHDDVALSPPIRQRLYEKGVALRQHSPGQGSLMFLVRRVEAQRDLERLAVAGYRFADVERVAGIIASRMHIKTPGAAVKLRQMAAYVDRKPSRVGGRMRMGFFAIRARVNSPGFDVHVGRDARHVLPSVGLPFSSLESWQADILKRFEGLTAASVLAALEATRMSTGRETEFIGQLKGGIRKLREALQDALVDDAVLAPGVIDISDGRGASTPHLMFRVVAPIHSVVHNDKYEYIPLSLFKAHQLVQMEAARLSFVRSVHCEFESIIGLQPLQTPSSRESSGAGHKGSLFDKIKTRTRRMRRPSKDWDEEQVLEGKPICRPSTTASNLSASTADLCRTKEFDEGTQHGSLRRVESPGQAVLSPLGGIMVSQEITVNVEKSKRRVRAGEGPLERAVITNEVTASSDIELQAKDPKRVSVVQVKSMPLVGVQPSSGVHDIFVDVLFRDAVESQWRRK